MLILRKDSLAGCFLLMAKRGGGIILAKNHKSDPDFVVLAIDFLFFKSK